MNEEVDETKQQRVTTRHPPRRDVRSHRHEKVVIAVQERQMRVFLLQNDEKLQRDFSLRADCYLISLQSHITVSNKSKILSRKYK